MRRPLTPRAAEPELDRGSVLDALHKIAIAIGETADAHSLAALMGRHARKLLTADDVTVYLWDSEAALLRLLFGQNSWHAHLPTMAAGEGAIGRAFESGEPEVVADYQNWEGALPQLLAQGIQRMAAVPLKVGNTTIGVLAVRFLDKGRFGPTHIRALQMLAAPVAGILEAAVVRQRAQADRALLSAIVHIPPRGVMLLDARGSVVSLNQPGLDYEARTQLQSERQVEARLASRLSRRERDVLANLARGETNRQIATALGLSPGTVKKHVEHILQKLGVTDRTQAAVRASELGFTDRRD